MIATGAVAGVGAVATVWPFVSQMNPDAAVLALASIEVDISAIAEGQEVVLKWRGNPVFVRHRSKAEIDAAKAVQLSDLKDPLARNANVKDGDDASDGCERQHQYQEAARIDIQERRRQNEAERIIKGPQEMEVQQIYAEKGSHHMQQPNCPSVKHIE